MDFTLKTYSKLLQTLINNDYHVFTVYDYALLNEKINSNLNECSQTLTSKLIINRHDIDLKPENALEIAKIENKSDIRSTYYFRTIPQTFNAEIIKEIADMGHEIGYHYENMTVCNGDFDLAIKDFEENLSKLREIVPVNTICMHGSPRSKWDAKDLWQKYDYHFFEIIAEPYIDFDFNKIFYLTDTGRRWDGWKYSIRDKIQQQEKWIKEGLIFYSTSQIMDAIKKNKFPKKVMMTTHPQRWTDDIMQWSTEFVLQNIKNIAKRFLIIKNK